MQSAWSLQNIRTSERQNIKTSEPQNIPSIFVKTMFILVATILNIVATMILIVLPPSISNFVNEKGGELTLGLIPNKMAL